MSAIDSLLKKRRRKATFFFSRDEVLKVEELAKTNSIKLDVEFYVPPDKISKPSILHQDDIFDEKQE